MPRARGPRKPPATPSWVPAPPQGASQPRIGYYVDDQRVWFYNEESGQWESGTIVSVPGLSGSTLRPFIQVDATGQTVEVGVEFVRLQG